MSRILVVEDDPAMSVALRDGFEFEKYAVEMAARRRGRAAPAPRAATTT